MRSRIAGSRRKGFVAESLVPIGSVYQMEVRLSVLQAAAKSWIQDLGVSCGSFERGAKYCTSIHNQAQDPTIQRSHYTLVYQAHQPISRAETT
jgi:hypothetical protein